MAGVFRLYNNLFIRRFLQPKIINTRAISTSKKNSDTAATTINQPAVESQSNWISYGFTFNNQAEDKQSTNSVFFFAISLCIILGSYVWAYSPDVQMRDWAQREAYLELRRREQAGLPLIDPNLVDPGLFSLPADEELADIEIII